MPIIIPLPVRVDVIVKVLASVCSDPRVMFTVAAEVLLLSVTSLVEADLLIVSTLKVFVPEIVTSFVPENVTVPNPALKVPLLIQSPLTMCELEPALKVVLVPILRFAFVVITPLAVLVLPFDKYRLS